MPIMSIQRNAGPSCALVSRDGSEVVAAVVAGGILRVRSRLYRRLELAESVDANRDGIPDVYQTEDVPDPER